jgi:hypothetical protein
MSINGQPVNLTASGAVYGSSCKLKGFYVNSTTAGTIVLRNGGASGTAVTGTITPAVGWHFLPADFSTGCYATIGGTLNVTFVFEPV